VKLFMHCDREGVSGIHKAEQIRTEEGTDLQIADVNGAVRAALDAGADAIIVCDTHGGGGNFVLDRMLQDARVTWLPRSRGEENGQIRWMPGLNETVDGFLLLGHHAKAGTEGAFTPHTESGRWGDFQINGRSMGEMGLESCFAGHWGVPVCFAQGDEAACREAEAMFPGIVTACVKKATARDAATGPDPEEARALTARKVARAVEAVRAGQCRPFQPQLPMTVTLRLVYKEDADRIAARPNVERLDDFTVQSTVDRHCDVVKWISGTGLP